VCGRETALPGPAFGEPFPGRHEKSQPASFVMPDCGTGLPTTPQAGPSRPERHGARDTDAGPRVNRRNPAVPGVLLDSKEFVPERIRRRHADVLCTAPGEADAYVTQS